VFHDSQNKQFISLKSMKRLVFVKVKEINFRLQYQTGFGAHSASYPMGIGISFPVAKAAGA
jgi:hypothetical protein